MRGVKIFAGNSHPQLTQNICERLSVSLGGYELFTFSNGEISVNISTSIREQDVFIVQSGSSRTNDSIMELLIMIAACKGGSAKSITAVMPYFPYSRQSKKKSHRGAITARMLANLLSVAGMDHIITVDLHAPPMQGFFGKPVDNLHAEPLIARWIKRNVKGWQDAVVVSKNPGGSKRVTSLADVLKLSFGIITTDRRRSPPGGSMIFDAAYTAPEINGQGLSNGTSHEIEKYRQPEGRDLTPTAVRETEETRVREEARPQIPRPSEGSPRSGGQSSLRNSQSRQPTRSSPLQRPLRATSTSPPRSHSTLRRRDTAPVNPVNASHDADADAEQFTDERAREVITGRLIQGHIVDDDYPSPLLSSMAGSVATLPGGGLGASATAAADERPDPMTQSLYSVGSVSSLHQLAEHALGGTFGEAELSDGDDEQLRDPGLEHTVTLVGDVAGRTVIIIDDIMDRSESWVAAAETVVKRGGATRVYCIATHGLLGDDALDELEACDCIDHVVVCNTFPIDAQKEAGAKKLEILDLAGMLAEAIRRNHYGESITKLYQYYDDI